VKIYRVIVGVIFGFLTVQCQAAQDLLNNDKDRISFSYNLLQKEHLTNYRAGVLLIAIGSSSLKAELEKKPNTLITLTRKNETLGVEPKLAKIGKSSAQNEAAINEYVKKLASNNWALTQEEIDSITKQLSKSSEVLSPLLPSTFSSPALSPFGAASLNKSGGYPTKFGTVAKTLFASPPPPQPTVIFPAISIDFTNIWNAVKSSGKTVYDRNFYHDYFLRAAHELYRTDRQVFSVAGGAKNWLSLTMTPVIIDALFGTGTINDDFLWLKEKNPHLQVIGYLAWLLENLNDTTLEKRTEKAIYKDLVEILKGRDAVVIGSRPVKLSKQKSIISKDLVKSEQEGVRAIGSAIVKTADWMSSKFESMQPIEILNYFKDKYGVDASETPTNAHRLILAFASSLAYMNPKDTLFNSSACTKLRTSIKEVKLQSHIPETFCASLNGKYLIR
jgi:hypothetical protein